MIITPIFNIPQELLQNICTFSTPRSWSHLSTTCTRAKGLFELMIHDPQKMSFLLSKAVHLYHGIKNFTTSFPKIHATVEMRLNITHLCTSVIRTMHTLCSTYTFNMQSLALSNVRVTAKDLNTIFTIIPSLKNFYITNCRRIIQDNNITTLNFPASLEQITISRTPGNPLAFIARIFQCCQALQSLFFSSLPQRVPCQNLQSWQPPHTLKKLELQGLVIDATEATSIFHRFRNLKALTICSMQQFSVGNFTPYSGSVIFFSLETINFSYTDISGEQLQTILPNCRQLIHCILRGCSQITKMNFLSMSWPTTLRKVIITGTKIDCNGINHLERCAPDLEYLSLDKCFELRKGISWSKPLRLWFPKKLKELSIQHVGITNKLLSHIIKRCKQLEFLNLTFCSHITNEGIIRCAFPTTLKHLILPYHIDNTLTINKLMIAVPNLKITIAKN